MSENAALLQNAIALHRAGKLNEAEAAYVAVPQNAPEHVDAVHLRGVLALQRGNAGQAIELIQQAIQIRNDVPAMHSNIAEAYRAMGRLNDAIAHARTALKLDPNYHACRANLGLALAADGQLKEAEKELRKVIEAEPRNASAWNNLGNVLRLAKQQDSALAATNKAVQLEPTNPEFLSNLGQLLVEDGDFEEARQRLENAVKLAPRMAAARNNLGNLYRELGLLDEAARQYDEALKLQPTLAVTHNNQGQLFQQRAEYDAAFNWYQKSLQLNPNDVKTLCNFASALSEVERNDDAKKLYHAALQLDPKCVPALCGIGGGLRKDADIEAAREYFERAIAAEPANSGGHVGLAGVLSELGKFEEAEREIREAIRLEKTPGAAYELLASTLRKKLPEKDYARMKELLSELKETRPRARAGLLFGLGIYGDQTGKFEEAAVSLDEANRLEGESLVKRGLNYKPEQHTEWIDSMIKVFSTEHFERVKGWGLDTDVPVFVLGLPRSGTTLAEQVLASHSKVYGADELRLARESLMSVPAVLGLSESVPACVPKLTREAVQQIATDHLKKLQSRAPEAERIVDKMPENYVNIGMIVTIFPNARIIHMQRDFRDVATSCWNVHFGQIRWANDKQHILSHFANYKRIMQHWHEVLPGRILDLPYAAMVDDLETQARRVLDFCGLEWDPACLEFHKTERTVRTASLAQVRQPLYKKAVERWRNYEPWWGDWYRQLDEIQSG
ncbi:MAG: tetratricopeptide repeat protein [Planctomycetes bacterium]|nr:tetratricopeptide repeat protein [Planctomycetota bacterium]